MKILSEEERTPDRLNFVLMRDPLFPVKAAMDLLYINYVINKF
jgi:hypothetical protein